MVTLLQTIFLRFYCLPYGEAAEYMAALGLFLLIARERFGKKCWWRPVLGGLLLIWIAILFYATVISRTPGQFGPPNLIPFHSYREVGAGGSWEILLSNYMNILLFFPGGLFLCGLLPGRWHWLLRVFVSGAVFALLSGAMEYGQYVWQLGLVEIDDVLHNVLGALLGAVFTLIPFPVRKAAAPGQN